jgi:hypothetical protein
VVAKAVRLAKLVKWPSMAQEAWVVTPPTPVKRERTTHQLAVAAELV